jgi:hypothetical protein
MACGLTRSPALSCASSHRFALPKRTGKVWFWCGCSLGAVTADCVAPHCEPRHEMPQNRDHFRIPFPIGERPQLFVGAAEFEVIDVSERGARIVRNGQWPDDGGGSFAATIRFRDGTTADVTAELHRKEADKLILRFGKQLSYSLITAEQRRLLRLYPRTALQQNMPISSDV